MLQETSPTSLSPVVIQELVFVIRGQQVMLDQDLARLYQVETKALNRAVNRNIDRFPQDFCFRLTDAELKGLRCQNGTSNADGAVSPSRGGRRYLPYAFTETGISMLSAVLRSDVAVSVSIQIMRAFVELRRYKAGALLLQDRLERVETAQARYQLQTDEKFEQLFSYISAHSEAEQSIFFEGQIYDAFQVLALILKKATRKIVLIDDYVDVRTLNLLKEKKRGVSVEIWTLPKTRLTPTDLETFNCQYPLATLHSLSGFHDRFLILDDSLAYGIGASLKDAGKKCFALYRINDTSILDSILAHLLP